MSSRNRLKCSYFNRVGYYQKNVTFCILFILLLENCDLVKCIENNSSGNYSSEVTESLGLQTDTSSTTATPQLSEIVSLEEKENGDKIVHDLATPSPTEALKPEDDIKFTIKIDFGKGNEDEDEDEEGEKGGKEEEEKDNNESAENEDDKMGRVKRRAIRSLMQIFGLPDEDNLLKKTSDSFGPAPEFMIDLYNTITDNYGVTRAKNPYGAHVIRSFMEKDSKKYDYFFFNLTSNGKLKETEKVVEAELHLYRNPIPHDRLHPSLYLTPFYILSLYQVVDSRNLAIPDLHKLLGVQYVPALGSGWQVFNVTQTIMEWVKGEKENLGFIVAATSLGGDRIPVTFSRRNDKPLLTSPLSVREKSNKQPILVLFNHDSEVEKINKAMMMSESNRIYSPTSYQQKKSKTKEGRDLNKDDEEEEDNDQDNSAPVLPNIPKSSLENPRFHHSLLYQDSIRHPNSVSRFRSRRSKNQTESTTETSSTTASSTDPDNPRNLTSCEKHDLFISFETIGWSSWIISPKGYNAFYCSGPCVFPLAHDVSPTNHATLQSIAHELALAPDVGRPCCVPTKLLPISLLYYDDDDNVVLKQYVDMVADTCGCH